MHRLTRVVALSGSLLLAGCELFTSDSASRTAFALREGARRLSGAPDSTLTVRIQPRQWPAGCKGDYRVDFVPDSSAVPGLAIRCLPDGPVYTSGGHLPLVHSDTTMSITIRATQPLFIVLRKDGQRIEVARFGDED